MYTIPEKAVQIHGNAVTTTSLAIAAVFGKEHKNVLRDIQNLEVPTEWNALNFEPVTYTGGNGEQRPMFNITRDGFVMLVMGFTGTQASKFKLAYIDLFNRMEARLKKLNPPQTYAEALRAHADQVERVEALEAQKAIDAPKVAYAEKMTDTKELMYSRELAKRLGMRSSNKFHDVLYDNGVIFYDPNAALWFPFADYADMDEVWFKTVPESYNGCPEKRILKWLPEGEIWIRSQWDKFTEVHEIKEYERGLARLSDRFGDFD